MILAALLALAGFVWAVDTTADPPLVPSQLAATPTASALAAKAADMATEEAGRSHTITVVLNGLSVTPLDIYRCAGEKYNTGRQMPADKRFDVLGWTVDVDATVWFLIKDDPDEAQEWVQSGPEVTISPQDYRFYFPAATRCK